MNTLTLFTVAKVAFAASELERHLELDRPLNFKVGDSSLRKIMHTVTASNFEQKLQDHPDFERVLTVFATSFAFLPVNNAEDYREMQSDLGGWASALGMRFSTICPKFGDAPIILCPVPRKLLRGNPLSANLDPEIQEAFASVVIEEDMSESKYKRRLIAALISTFGEGVVENAVWEEDSLTFGLHGLSFTQHGLPVDDDEDEEAEGEYSHQSSEQ